MADQEWGPTVRGRARRRRPLRLVALLLVAVLLLAVGSAAWLAWRIPRTEVTDLAASGTPMHVLVVGSDSREDLTPEQRRELTTGATPGDRADTIFVMSVRGSEVALLAFPRDLWVPRCDGSVGRINAAEDIDGPGCLVRTVRDLSGIDVQHYVRVTFGGFVDIVDAVGGVELCLEEAISDRDAGIDLPAGCQRLDGPDALGYVRVRKIDDDFGRIERQQRFLKALANEIASPQTLLNPVRWVTVSTQAGDAVLVDRGMGIVPLARLGLGARGLAGGDAVTHAVPASPHTTGGGAQVLRIREAEAEALFSRFRDGSIFDEIAPTPDATGSGATR
jgi:LCP family protein required for cell wall assembly